MSRYRHWLNVPQGGETAFITTKVLDFAPVFAREEIRDLVVASFLDDCDFYGALIGAFAVMVNHAHVLAAMPPNLSASQFAQRIKKNSNDRIRPQLSAEELALVAHQAGLNNRSLWERGFRGLGVTDGATYHQKLNYIHRNPVRARICNDPGDYRWSSAPTYLAGRGDWEFGLRLPELIEHFHPGRLPWPRKARRLDGSLRQV